jgi:putative spermidine/putrescine transport system substrate-binding protein
LTTNGTQFFPAPAVHEERVLRLLGTSSTLLDLILERASKDLGIKLEARILDGGDAHRLGVTAPETYDLYDQWFHNVEFVWTARSIQAIDTSRIRYWDEVGDVARSGRLSGVAKVAPGTAPNRLLYVDEEGELGPTPSRYISMLPLTHYADTFGYIADELPPGYDPKNASWAWLLDPHIGACALQNNPSIGAIDAMLAVQAAGLATFADPGNLTIEEIDTFVDELMKLRMAGHFSGFWGTSEDLAGLIKRRRTKVFSLWSPTRLLPEVAARRVRMAVPKEGYRGWCGGIALSRHCAGPTMDMAYEYLNWWLDGWASIPITRQGDYFSSPSRASRHMNPGEWDYWYGGKPATQDIPSNHDTPAAAAGDMVEGGSYEERISRVTVWNAVGDEHNYLARRWNDFLNRRR